MLSFLFKILLVIVLIGGFLIYWFFFKVYSEGEREGVLVKFTKKGNVFKTYEGEIWLSCRQVINVEKFFFSVTDEALSDSLMKMQDDCISVSYKQYLRNIAWRGDSKYVVVSFAPVGAGFTPAR